MKSAHNLALEALDMTALIICKFFNIAPLNGGFSSLLERKQLLSSCVAFTKITDIAMVSQNHVAHGVAQNGFFMRCHTVQQLFYIVHYALCWYYYRCQINLFFLLVEGDFLHHERSK